MNFIEDGTVIDAYGAQDERYFSHRLNEIREWLSTPPSESIECVLNFRGGEFSLFPELFLPEDYWVKGITSMLGLNRSLNFEVHTDDPVLARKIFPDFPITSEIETNWKAIRYAKNLILSNSAFGIIPSLLNEKAEIIIAPRYWARRNIQQWSTPQNYYKRFTYI